MYRLRVMINPDGDFYYNAVLPGCIKNDEPQMLYFKERKNVTNIMINFYRDLCDTIKSSKVYVQRDVCEKIISLQHKVETVFRKFDTFHISMYFGNQEIEIELDKVDLVKVPLYDTKETIDTFALPEDQYFADSFNLSSFENYSWDVIEAIEDL